MSKFDKNKYLKELYVEEIFNKIKKVESINKENTETDKQIRVRLQNEVSSFVKNNPLTSLEKLVNKIRERNTGVKK